MSFCIPRASGPSAVACVDILDKTGLDSTFFRIFYPTEKFEPVKKICPPWMNETYLNGFAGLLGGGCASKIMKCFLKSKLVPVRWNGPLEMPMNISQLPVIVVSHGLGLSKNAHTFLSSEIASRGFLVAAVDHKDKSASASVYLEKESDGGYKEKSVEFQHIKMQTPEEQELRYQQITQRVDDISKLINCVEQLNNGTLHNVLSEDVDLSVFKDKLDVKKCAIIGHSFGGGTTIAALEKESRIKVSVAMDAWLYPLEQKYYKIPINKPLLYINADGYIDKKEVLRMRRLDADVTGIDAERKMVTLRGAVHMTYTDMGFFPRISCIAKMIGMRGPTDPEITNEMNLKLLLGFIGKHLDLPCAKEVETIVSENSDLCMMGTNVAVEDQEIKEAKFSSPDIGSVAEKEVNVKL
uniref:platelet-activating factor acetylhydrolase-like n=1 Tax=Styela clava TaxID=7725 RepID=UPI00193A8235|nr:platelet-activating factor acetylhydrolase-like [Styela clava]